MKPVPATVSGRSVLEAAVVERFGVLPNFFRTATEAPGLIDELWGFAKSAYLDNPLPSLFKERLFVHLSRFCQVRYCIIRHVGFLIGQGRPAGDPKAIPQSIEQVVTLLRRPAMLRGVQLSDALSRLESARGPITPPEPDTQAEYDIFAAASTIFIDPLNGERARNALRSALGARNFEFLTAYLAFIRTAHYWTETHPELIVEDDMKMLLRDHEELAKAVLDISYAQSSDMGERLFNELTALRREQRARDATLHRSEEQFQLLVQSVTDYAIYMLNPTGIVTNWNSGAERIKGYKPEEIIGQHFSKFYSEADRAAGEPQRGLDTAAREGRFEKEGWRFRKDGSRFWASVVLDPIRSPSGVLLGFAKITRDITERRESQIALEQARETLFQSQKLEAIGQLTGGVAHDFNNLLTAVLGSLELLNKRLPDEPKIKVLLNNAFEGAKRGVALTQRMLAFARRQELALADVDLGALTGGITELMERTLGPSINIEARIPINLPRVKADANQLEAALINLVLNARDAMPKGGTIKIIARQEKVGADSATKLQPGNYVCVMLTDEGEGMDEATLARATEPFFTTKGVGKGTGLGLSMVHGMAEQLSGRLYLKSRIGEGTTAEVWIPVAEAGTGTKAATEPQVPKAQSEMRPLTIVVVDDDRLVLVNTSAMIEELGHTVIEASSGKQALEILRTINSVDLVITDQAMPQMTGTELAKILKAEQPGLPMLLVTGYAELPANADIGLPKLGKPFLLDELEKALARCMPASHD